MTTSTTPAPVARAAAPVSFLRETVGNFFKHDAPTQSAALAFYTIFSLAPVLLVVIAVAGVVFGQDAVRARLITELARLMGAATAAAIDGMLDGTVQPRGISIASVVGVVTFLLGSTAVFIQLQETLNRVWEVEPTSGRMLAALLRKRLVSFGLLLGIGFLLLVSLVVTAALTAASAYLGARWTAAPPLAIEAAHVLIELAVTTMLFAMMFRFLPDVRVSWRSVWLGAAVTALLFGLGKLGIGLYLGRAGMTSAYGAAGSLILILLWVYYSSMILLFGAELTHVQSRREVAGPVVA